MNSMIPRPNTADSHPSSSSSLFLSESIHSIRSTPNHRTSTAYDSKILFPNKPFLTQLTQKDVVYLISALISSSTHHDKLIDIDTFVRVTTSLLSDPESRIRAIYQSMDLFGIGLVRSDELLNHILFTIQTMSMHETQQYFLQAGEFVESLSCDSNIGFFFISVTRSSQTDRILACNRKNELKVITADSWELTVTLLLPNRSYLTIDAQQTVPATSILTAFSSSTLIDYPNTNRSRPHPPAEPQVTLSTEPAKNQQERRKSMLPKIAVADPTQAGAEGQQSFEFNPISNEDIAGVDEYESQEMKKTRRFLYLLDRNRERVEKMKNQEQKEGRKLTSVTKRKMQQQRLYPSSQSDDAKTNMTSFFPLSPTSSPIASPFPDSDEAWLSHQSQNGVLGSGFENEIVFTPSQTQRPQHPFAPTSSLDVGMSPAFTLPDLSATHSSSRSNRGQTQPTPKPKSDLPLLTDRFHSMVKSTAMGEEIKQLEKERRQKKVRNSLSAPSKRRSVSADRPRIPKLNIVPTFQSKQHAIPILSDSVDTTLLSQRSRNRQAQGLTLRNKIEKRNDLIAKLNLATENKDKFFTANVDNIEDKYGLLSYLKQREKKKEFETEKKDEILRNRIAEGRRLLSSEAPRATTPDGYVSHVLESPNVDAVFSQNELSDEEPENALFDSDLGIRERRQINLFYRQFKTSLPSETLQTFHREKELKSQLEHEALRMAIEEEVRQLTSEAGPKKHANEIKDEVRDESGNEIRSKILKQISDQDNQEEKLTKEVLRLMIQKKQKKDDSERKVTVSLSHRKDVADKRRRLQEQGKLIVRSVHDVELEDNSIGEKKIGLNRAVPRTPRMMTASHYGIHLSVNQEKRMAGMDAVSEDDEDEDIKEQREKMKEEAREHVKLLKSSVENKILPTGGMFGQWFNSDLYQAPTRTNTAFLNNTSLQTHPQTQTDEAHAPSRMNRALQNSPQSSPDRQALVPRKNKQSFEEKLYKKVQTLVATDISDPHFAMRKGDIQKGPWTTAMLGIPQRGSVLVATNRFALISYNSQTFAEERRVSTRTTVTALCLAPTICSKSFRREMRAAEDFALGYTQPVTTKSQLQSGLIGDDASRQIAWKVNDSISAIDTTGNEGLLVLGGDLSGNIHLFRPYLRAGPMQFVSAAVIHKSKITSILPFSERAFFSCSMDGSVCLVDVSGENRPETKMVKTVLVRTDGGTETFTEMIKGRLVADESILKGKSASEIRMISERFLKELKEEDKWVVTQRIILEQNHHPVWTEKPKDHRRFAMSKATDVITTPKPLSVSGIGAARAMDRKEAFNASMTGRSEGFGSTTRRGRTGSGADEVLDENDSLAVHGYTCMAISRKRTLLFVGTTRGYIYSHNLMNGRLLGSMKEHQSYLIALFIDDERGLLISVGEDKTIKLWSVNDNSLLQSIHETTVFYPTDRFTCADYDQNQHILYAGGNMVRAYRLNISADSAQIKAEVDAPQSPQNKPKKLTQQLSTHSLIQLSKSSTSCFNHSFVPHTAPVQFVLYSGVFRVLITISTPPISKKDANDGIASLSTKVVPCGLACVWDLQTGRKKNEITLRSSHHSITSAFLDPQQRALVFIDGNGCVIITNFHSGEMIAESDPVPVYSSGPSTAHNTSRPRPQSNTTSRALSSQTRQRSSFNFGPSVPPPKKHIDIGSACILPWWTKSIVVLNANSQIFSASVKDWGVQMDIGLNSPIPSITQSLASISLPDIPFTHDLPIHHIQTTNMLFPGGIGNLVNCTRVCDSTSWLFSPNVRKNDKLACYMPCVVSISRDGTLLIWQLPFSSSFQKQIAIKKALFSDPKFIACLEEHAFHPPVKYDLSFRIPKRRKNLNSGDDTNPFTATSARRESAYGPAAPYLPPGGQQLKIVYPPLRFEKEVELRNLADMTIDCTAYSAPLEVLIICETIPSLPVRQPEGKTQGEMAMSRRRDMGLGVTRGSHPRSVLDETQFELKHHPSEPVSGADTPLSPQDVSTSGNHALLIHSPRMADGQHEFSDPFERRTSSTSQSSLVPHAPGGQKDSPLSGGGVSVNARVTDLHFPQFLSFLHVYSMHLGMFIGHFGLPANPNRVVTDSHGQRLLVVYLSGAVESHPSKANVRMELYSIAQWPSTMNILCEYGKTPSEKDEEDARKKTEANPGVPPSNAPRYNFQNEVVSVSVIPSQGHDLFVVGDDMGFVTFINSKSGDVVASLGQSQRWPSHKFNKTREMAELLKEWAPLPQDIARKFKES